MGAGAGALSNSQKRVDAIRLLQALVISYENMTREQRRRSALRDKALVAALEPLLEVATAIFPSLSLSSLSRLSLSLVSLVIFSRLSLSLSLVSLVIFSLSRSVFFFSLSFDVF